MLRIANATLLATLSCGGLMAAEKVDSKNNDLDRVHKLMAADDWVSAKSVATDLIDHHANSGRLSDQTLAGGAYAALGKICATEAAQQEAKGRTLWANTAYADARWAYLNAMTYLVADDERAATALFEAGVCYAKLASVETDGYSNAERTFKAVLRWYPKSKAAALAQAKLNASEKN